MSPESQEVEAAVRQAAERWGRLDMVFANAGINGTWAPIDKITPEEWDQVMDINLKGTYLTVHHAVPYLRKQGGSIVITSSVNGTRMFSNVGASAYADRESGPGGAGQDARARPSARTRSASM